MKYKDIASIAGKSGLYKVVSPSKTGVIVEALDGSNKRFAASVQNRISLLGEISIYTTDAEASRPLSDVFHTIHKEFEGDLGVDAKSDGNELHAFMKHVLPDYDAGRVYTSDIKKLVSWYGIINKHYPDLLATTSANDEEE